MATRAPQMMNAAQLRARAELLRGAAAKAGDAGMVDMLLGKAAQLEGDASLLEHSADKPSGDEISMPPKPLR
jgi:hypothetical protein